MKPATSFSAQGTAFENGLRLYVTEQARKRGGCESEFVLGAASKALTDSGRGCRMGAMGAVARH